jgi:hypothetical protein
VRGSQYRHTRRSSYVPKRTCPIDARTELPRVVADANSRVELELIVQVPIHRLARVAQIDSPPISVRKADGRHVDSLGARRQASRWSPSSCCSKPSGQPAGAPWRARSSSAVNTTAMGKALHQCKADFDGGLLPGGDTSRGISGTSLVPGDDRTLSAASFDPGLDTYVRVESLSSAPM